jgi:hypothetical protein
MGGLRGQQGFDSYAGGTGFPQGDPNLALVRLGFAALDRVKRRKTDRR